MRRINRIIIHCSDSDFGDVALINDWHLKRGWSGCGYHYVILNGYRSKDAFNYSDQGLVEMGRPENAIGSHVKGANEDSIGICLIGKTKFSSEQMNALLYLVRYINSRHGKLKIQFHRDYTEAKTCPNLSDGWKEVLNVI